MGSLKNSFKNDIFSSPSVFRCPSPSYFTRKFFCVRIECGNERNKDKYLSVHKLPAATVYVNMRPCIVADSNEENCEVSVVSDMQFEPSQEILSVCVLTLGLNLHRFVQCATVHVLTNGHHQHQQNVKQRKLPFQRIHVMMTTNAKIRPWKNPMN